MTTRAATRSLRTNSARKGFTLVEILIVVIILGILAAIVIPQFTNASEDARKSSLTSQLQTIRSQVELYKLQHRDELPPALAAGGTGEAPWGEMVVKTDADHTINTAGQFGPYLQAAPSDSLNGFSGVEIVSVDQTAGGAVSGTDVGFVLNTANGKVWATSKTGKFIYDEGNSSAPTNAQ